MLGKSRVLGIVPARGGSKGVPKKNIRVVAGRPLIHWTIAAARASSIIDRVVVSSDDDEICDLVLQYGLDIPLKRPAHLATDDATSLNVVLHVLDTIPGYDTAILLQPTSPLRNVSDIDACLNLLARHQSNSCIGICEANESPYWMYTLTEAGKVSRLLTMAETYTRRQDLPPVYVVNGALYAFRVDWLRAGGRFIDDETIGYVMPQSRSLDIDTETDLQLFESIVGQPPPKTRA